jgi:hypothetical protein
MPRVTFVKAARKDNPVAKKGESYYWWKFRYGGKRFSLTRPRQSQLTRSAYFGTVYGMQEGIEDCAVDNVDDFESLKDDITSQVDDLRDETQGSLDNMPDSLQYSPTGELLQERIDALEGIESEIDCIEEFDFDEEEYEYEDFDPDGYDTDEERDEAEVEFNIEQNKLCAEHNDDEELRMEAELAEWCSEAKCALSEAVDTAIV